MLGIVPAAVAQVDAADVGHVQVRTTRVPEHDELLVVGATGADPHVQQAFPAGRFDLVAEVPVFHGAEGQAVEV
jgi:hypothetical protein